MPDPTATATDLDAYLEPRREERLERLQGASCASPASPRCPSMRPTFAARPSGWPKSCAAAGIEHVEVSETGGHPIVYGDWLHADGAPTVLVYGHYDVQPVDPLDEWHIAAVRAGRGRWPDHRSRLGRRQGPDPRSTSWPRRRSSRRAVACRSTCATSSRARRRSRSVHLDAWLEANRDRLAGDVAIISDTGFFEGNIPAITIVAARA